MSNKTLSRGISCIAIGLGLALAATPPAFAQATQPDDADEVLLAVDGVFGFLFGDDDDPAVPSTGPVVGLMARAGVDLEVNLKLTGSLGYVRTLPPAEPSATEILILAGARYELGELAVELASGINIRTLSSSIDDMDVSETHSRVPLLFRVSYAINYLEPGFELLAPNLLLTERGEGKPVIALLTFGYRFL